MIVALIVACEVGFRVLLAAGLAVRYLPLRRRTGVVLLLCEPVLELVLFAATAAEGSVTLPGSRRGRPVSSSAVRRSRYIERCSSGLRSAPDIEVVGEAADGEQAVAPARELCPDLVLMDVQMPRLDGVSATRQVVAEHLADVLVLTTFDLDA